MPEDIKLEDIKSALTAFNQDNALAASQQDIFDELQKNLKKQRLEMQLEIELEMKKIRASMALLAPSLNLNTLKEHISTLLSICPNLFEQEPSSHANLIAKLLRHDDVEEGKEMLSYLFTNTNSALWFTNDVLDNIDVKHKLILLSDMQEVILSQPRYSDDITKVPLALLQFFDIDKMSTAQKKSILEVVHLEVEPSFLTVIYENINKYFLNLKPLQAAIEFNRMLKNPRLIDQGATNLCGVSSYLVWLTNNHPEQVKQLFIDLLTTGQSQTAITATARPRATDYNNTFQFLMSSIKNSQNYFGYSKDSFTESLSGLTGTSSQVSLLSKHNNVIHIDDVSIMTNQGYRVPNTLLQVIRAGYSRFNQTVNRKMRLNNLVESCRKKLDVLALLSEKLAYFVINKSWSDKATQTKGNVIPNPLKVKPYYNGVFSCIGAIPHWVNITKCEETESDEIRIEFDTYGEHYAAEVPRNEFLLGYMGAIHVEKTSSPVSIEEGELDLTNRHRANLV